MKGSDVGKTNILSDDEVAISRQLMAIRVSNIDRDYLYNFLKFQFSFFQDLATGAAIPGLSRQNVLGLDIPTPSLQEQKRIVAIVDQAFEAIDGAIENTKQNLANARKFFESYLNDVYPENDGWQEQKLEDICREITVGHVGSMASKYHSTGIPFLRSQNIRV